MRLQSAVLATVLMATGAMAKGDTFYTSFTAFPTTFGFYSTPFSMFDPSLGTLTSYDFEVGGAIFAPGQTDLVFSTVLGRNTILELHGGVPIYTTPSGTEYGIMGSTTVTSASELAAVTLGAPGSRGTKTGVNISDIANPLVDSGYLSGSITYNFTPAGVPAVTPEPSGLILLATGVLGLAGVLRRKFVQGWKVLPRGRCA